ncbi:MAG: hypothetical protein IJS52_05495 [Bacilli bacterium]|nr:hypothetical protein [Bacilli bacterium]
MPTYHHQDRGDDGNAVDFELDESYWNDLPKLNSYLQSIEIMPKRTAKPA